MDENNGNIRFLSVISYLGIFFIVGRFAVEKDNPDLRFHTYQGGVMFVIFGIMYFLDYLFYILLSFAPALQIIFTFLLSIAISVAYILLIIMGIMSAYKFEQRLLPFVGNIAVKLRVSIDTYASKRK